MNVIAHPRRAAGAFRQGTHLTVIAVNAVLLGAIWLWPGWQAASVLTSDAAEAVWLTSLALGVGIVANIVYLVDSELWVRSLLGIAVLAPGLGAAIRALRVLPFDFPAWLPHASVLAQVVLGATVLAMLVGLVVHLVALVRVVMIQ